MPTAKAIVLLTAYRGADVLNIPNAAPWYVQYFFNPDYFHRLSGRAPAAKVGFQWRLRE